MKIKEKIKVLTEDLKYQYAQIEKLSGISKGSLGRALKNNKVFKRKTQKKINNLFKFIQKKVEEVLNDKDF